MDGAALRAGRGRERGAPARAVLSASRGRAATRGLGLGQDDRAADLRWRESICSATCVLPNTASACAWLWARQWTRRFEGSPDTPRARATMSVDLEQRACRATFAQVADECALLAVAREHLAPRRAARETCPGLQGRRACGARDDLPRRSFSSASTSLPTAASTTAARSPAGSTPRPQNALRRHTTDTKRKSCIANCRIVAALTSAFADSPQTLRGRATTVDASLRGAYRPSRDHPFP